jgi:hypothetical protein
MKKLFLGTLMVCFATAPLLAGDAKDSNKKVKTETSAAAGCASSSCCSEKSKTAQKKAPKSPKAASLAKN